MTPGQRVRVKGTSKTGTAGIQMADRPMCVVVWDGPDHDRLLAYEYPPPSADGWDWVSFARLVLE